MWIKKNTSTIYISRPEPKSSTETNNEEWEDDWEQQKKTHEIMSTLKFCI